MRHLCQNIGFAAFCGLTLSGASTAQKDRAAERAERTLKAIRSVLERTSRLEAVRCRTTFAFVGEKVRKHLVPRAVESCYANGAHVWARSVKSDNAKLAAIDAIEVKIEQLRLKRKPDDSLAALEAKRGKLLEEFGSGARAGVFAERSGRWARRYDHEWIPCRKPQVQNFFPDPRFLSERLLDGIGRTKWQATVGTLEQKPVQIYRAKLDRLASTRLLLAGAVTDVGFRGHHDEHGISLRGDGWSSSRSGRNNLQLDCEVEIYVDPPTKNVLRIRVKMLSPSVDSMVRSVRGGIRVQFNRQPQPKNTGKDSWTCRLDFDLRRHGRVTTTGLDAAARKILRSPRPQKDK